MIVLIGESGSGKTTLEKELEKLGYSRIISYTTRKPRAHEIDGVHYHFVTAEEFANLKEKGFFAEVVEYNGNYYGTAAGDCRDDRVIVVEPNGLRQLKQHPGLNIKSFYLKSDDITRYLRMIGEGRSKLDALERLYNDAKVFDGIEDEVDYVVDSSVDVDTTLKQILGELK